MKHTLTLLKWLAPAAALFALACALLAPAEALSARRTRRAQDGRATRREKSDDIPDDSTVRGRVVYDETSRPVRRARVMLVVVDGGRRGEYGALTDARGEFRIPNVRAGSYYAFVDVPGVLSPIGFISLDDIRAAASGMPDLGEGRKYFDRVEVDGKQDVTVTVHARHGAAISGRVSYADGDPAVNVSVTIMRRGADGRVQKYLAGSSMASLAGLRTDDRGVFRLMGLPPGEYLIGVNEAVNHGPETGAGTPGDDISNAFRGMFAQQLLMVFYPSATSLKEAGSIKVEAGEERSDIDITIPERDLRTVGGVVRARRGGNPVARARVTITRRDDPFNLPSPSAPYYDSDSVSGTNSTTTDEAGRWQFKEIPDGAYAIQVKPSEEYEETTASTNMNTSVSDVEPSAENRNTTAYSRRRLKRTYAPGRVNLDVSGGDVSEFIVELAEGGHVAGTVTVEGMGQPRYGRVSLLRVGEGSAPDTETTAGGSIEGGRFDVGGLSSGRFMVQAYVGDTEGEVYLKSITWNGKDLTREPVEVTEGGTVEGVHIVFGRNPATLNVAVRGDRRRRAGVVVFVLSSDPSKWTMQVQPLFCRTEEDGSCRVTGSPGEYVLVAMPSTVIGTSSFETELRRRAAAAPRVTLREGEATRAEVDAPDN